MSINRQFHPGFDLKPTQDKPREYDAAIDRLINDETERLVRRQIADIQARHRIELEPFIKLLCDIEAIRQPAPVIFVAVPPDPK